MFLDSDERSTRSALFNKKSTVCQHTTGHTAGWNELLEGMDTSDYLLSNTHAPESRQEDGLEEDSTCVGDVPSSVLIYEIPRQNLSLLQESVTNPRTRRRNPIDHEGEEVLAKRNNSRASRSKQRKPSSRQRRRGLVKSENSESQKTTGASSDQFIGCNEFDNVLDLDWRELAQQFSNCFQSLRARIDSMMEYGKVRNQEDMVETSEVRHRRQRRTSRSGRRMMSTQTFQV